MIQFWVACEKIFQKSISVGMILWLLYFCYGWYKWYAYRNLAWFTGKKVLITGGAGGLGIELTKIFQKLGSTVILWDVNSQRLEEIKKEYNVQGYCVNLSDLASVEEAIGVTLKEGGVDILINNAGMVIGKSLEECDNKLIHDLMTVNVTSHHWTTKGFLPHMKKNKDGHIVTIASIMGSFAATHIVPYCASKGGAILFGEGLRVELYGTGVETTTVMPWHINTTLFKGLDFPWITRKIAPTLRVEYVAGQIIEAIRTRNKMLIMPKIFWIIYLLRAIVPIWLFDLICRKAGSRTVMNSFAK